MNKKKGNEPHETIRITLKKMGKVAQNVKEGKKVKRKTKKRRKKHKHMPVTCRIIKKNYNMKVVII